MHARMVTAQVQPDTLDQVITIFREAILPAAQQQKGFVGARLFVDRATNKGRVVSRWQSEADLLAGEASGYYQEQLARVLPFFATPPTREIFEIAVEGGA